MGERRKRAQSCGPTEVSAEASTASRRLRDAAVWVPPRHRRHARLPVAPALSPSWCRQARAPGTWEQPRLHRLGSPGSASPQPGPASRGQGARAWGGGAQGVFWGVPLLPGLPPASVIPAVRRSPQGCFSGPSHPGPREAHRLSLTLPRVTFRGVRAGRRLGGEGSPPYPD